MRGLTGFVMTGALVAVYAAIIFRVAPIRRVVLGDKIDSAVSGTAG